MNLRRSRRSRDGDAALRRRTSCRSPRRRRLGKRRVIFGIRPTDFEHGGEGRSDAAADARARPRSSRTSAPRRTSSSRSTRRASSPRPSAPPQDAQDRRRETLFADDKRALFTARIDGRRPDRARHRARARRRHRRGCTSSTRPPAPCSGGRVGAEMALPLFDLPLDELRAYRSKATAPDGLDDFWAGGDRRGSGSILRAHARAVPRRGLRRARGRRRHLRRRRRRPGARLVSPAGRIGRRTAPLSRHLRRLRRRARSPRDARALPSLRLRDIRDGHPGPGWHLVDGTHARSWRRLLRSGTPRRHDARHSRARRTYYYRRLYVDAVRAVDTAAGLPGVDAGRIAVAGKSQGGALALAAAALVPDAVRLCHADVPFLCDIERGMGHRARAALHRARHLPRRSTPSSRTPRDGRCATSTSPCWRHGSPHAP